MNLRRPGLTATQMLVNGTAQRLASRWARRVLRGDRVGLDRDTYDAQAFDAREMDKIIRQIVDKVRGNYFLNGETGRGMPGEVKRIIENNIDRV